MNGIDGDWIVGGELRVGGTLRLNASSGIARDQLTQENLTPFDIPPTTWRIFDNMDALLPDPPTGGAGNDDLGILSGAFGTATPSIQTGDNKAAGLVAKYGRRTIQLPPNYVAGETVVIRLHAGMKTTVASASATVDISAYKSNNEAGVDGADLCTTAATTCNSLVMADKDFTITATTLAPGDILDVLIVISTNDAATATAVAGCIGRASLLCDTKG